MLYSRQRRMSVRFPEMDALNLNLGIGSVLQPLRQMPFIMISGFPERPPGTDLGTRSRRSGLRAAMAAARLAGVVALGWCGCGFFAAHPPEEEGGRRFFVNMVSATASGRACGELAGWPCSAFATATAGARCAPRCSTRP